MWVRKIRDSCCKRNVPEEFAGEAEDITKTKHLLPLDCADPNPHKN